MTVIELFRSVTVLESVKVFVALIDSLGVIIIVSSSSSFKLSSIPVNVTVPLVEPGGILIWGPYWTCLTLLLLVSEIYKLPFDDMCIARG